MLKSKKNLLCIVFILFCDKAFSSQSPILFLTIDSLRPDKISCYGFEKKTTPNIDKLCDQAFVFLNAYASAGWTSPSLVSIFSSLYPTTHGIEVRGLVLNSKIKTPIKILNEKGWKTYGEHSEGDTIGNIGFYPTKGTITKFLEEIKDENFFVWYHIRTPHLPYDPPEEYIREFLNGLTADQEKIRIIREKKMIVKGKDNIEFTDTEKKFVEVLYEADVKYLDSQIGEVIEKLKELGIFDKTIVVLTADHGEELFEHGWIGHASTSLDGHLYNEIIKIPLIIRTPDIKKRTYIQTPVSHVDIMPILFSMLGIKEKFLTDSGVIKVSKSNISKKDNVIFSSTSPCGWQCKEDEKWKRIYVIQEKNWKLIYYNYDGNKPKERFELFKLPDEKNDLSQENPEKLSYMVKKLFETIGEHKAKQALFQPEVYIEKK